MRCGSGLADTTAAGVGGLVGGVDAACASSHILGGFDETLFRTKSRRLSAVGPGADPAPTCFSSMRTVSQAPLVSMTVLTSRFPRAGVHNPDMVSMATCRVAGTAP